jgi:hypothetical protein
LWALIEELPGTVKTMQRRFGAWIRYGDPISQDQVEFAVTHYASAVLQPWEEGVAAQLKAARPDMTVLAYKCLSSTRSYEPGPRYTSGLSWREANTVGEHLFAHRGDGKTRIEWVGYPGHWQMAVWEPEYRERWISNVVAEFRDSAWDGVMADNDVFDDYYELSPLFGGRGMDDIRAGLDELIAGAGRALNAAGKILVPNIAESRREPGRWQRHAAFGGGFEEVWLAWAPDRHLDTADVLAQTECLRGPGLTLVRTASDGTDTHPNVLFGLAVFWIFGAGRRGTSFTATGHDQYSGIPHTPQLSWDVGSPTSTVRRKGSVRHRAFTDGWAAAHLGRPDDRIVRLAVPAGLVTETGDPAPSSVTLPPRHGVLLRRPSGGRQ